MDSSAPTLSLVPNLSTVTALHSLVYRDTGIEVENSVYLPVLFRT